MQRPGGRKCVHDEDSKESGWKGPDPVRPVPDEGSGFYAE